MLPIRGVTALYVPENSTTPIFQEAAEEVLVIGKVAVAALIVAFLSIASVCAQETMQEGETLQDEDMMIQEEEMVQDEETMQVEAVVQDAVAESPSLHGARAGAQVSTLGLGMFAAWDAWDAVAVRGMINYFDYDFGDREEAGNEYNVDLQLQSLGLILDWHALRNGFRVSGGVFFNQNEFSIMAEDSGLEIGDGLYDGVLDALVDFNGMAPYLGLGWSGGRGRSGFSVGIEAGILFQGTPKLSVNGTVTTGAGTMCDFSVSEAGKATVCPALGELKADLEAEHRELSGELDSYQLYPVLSLGVSYRF